MVENESKIKSQTLIQIYLRSVLTADKSALQKSFTRLLESSDLQN